MKKINLPAPLAINRAGTIEILKDPGGGKKPATIKPQLPWIDAMHQQAINFINAIKRKAKPPCDAFDAFTDLEIAYDYVEKLMTAKK